ncbi:methyltransferase domain-containing protein [Actinokineospora cianjurensis]|uniref:Cyclopropane fatty-acyl-phospholipid synthase-like methyltransferase n=1 Tax=Actinokineospora cianjurensis TaxID=585224 RepID=A0A421B2Z3_9PSEU|nr:methyltransferase domain-containing protein [Actinokineospora cianjurensis]RLK58749.1 cyclopropane fatty-acyl-phospholipid synthase-like methyltransferase [Actinokineospora cianjurensis]
MTASTTDEYQRAAGAIAPIWAELLNTGDDRITPSTDFFAAGGHSLTAMLLVTRVATDLGKSVPLFALVENPTLAAFVEYVLRAEDATAVVEERAPDGSTTQTERLLGYNEPTRRENRNQRFEYYYANAISSAAHAEFCEQVYGRNLGQHGMADFGQIDRMLELLGAKEGDTILDLGCGYGLISQYIAEKTGANVVGVDLSASAIAYAQGLAESDDRLSFQVQDANDLTFPAGTFTHIVSIDTIYYAPSLRDLLRRFQEIGTADLRVGIVRTFPIRTFTADTWSPDRTELATLLRELFGGYDTVDLSREENAHWKKKVEVLDSLRGRFAAEGNEELFEFRYAEAAYEAGIEQYRYMFVSRTA